MNEWMPVVGNWIRDTFLWHSQHHSRFFFVVENDHFSLFDVELKSDYSYRADGSSLVEPESNKNENKYFDW